MRRRLSRLQMITDCPEATEKACKSGVRWVQIRIKDLDLHCIKNKAQEMVRICKKYKAMSIVNDHPAIALAVNADGVHLGKNDMPVAEARKQIGNKHLIIGGTANTLEDIAKLAQLKVDYIGLGPFRFTETKKNLSPVLGLDGYQRLLELAHQHHTTLPPVYAIGGILPDDVPSLVHAGVYGIAVSSALTQAEHMPSAIKQFIKTLK